MAWILRRDLRYFLTKKSLAKIFNIILWQDVINHVKIGVITFKKFCSVLNFSNTVRMVLNYENCFFVRVLFFFIQKLLDLRWVLIVFMAIILWTEKFEFIFFAFENNFHVIYERFKIFAIFYSYVDSILLLLINWSQFTLIKFLNLISIHNFVLISFDIFNKQKMFWYSFEESLSKDKFFLRLIAINFR